MIVCERVGVVVLFAVLVGILHEDDNDVVCEFGKNRRMCERFQSALVKFVSEGSPCHHLGTGNVQQIVGGPSATSPA